MLKSGDLMFLGEYRHTIDNKGRLIIPARFRELLGEKFVITKGLDNCLFVYPEAEWGRIAMKLQDLPFTREDARAFTRLFLAGACESEVDGQGRTLLPLNLRHFAGMSKDVCLIGVGSRFEIWDMDRWGNYTQRSEREFGDIANKMADLGI